MKPLILFFLSISALAASPTPKAPIHRLDIWGACYLQFNCAGGMITNGVTGEECRARGGHSLFMPNVNRCFNL
ncbi:MAG: hypothetical protein ACXWQO_05270 [Bdellovibrionota bacterium]